MLKAKVGNIKEGYYPVNFLLPGGIELETLCKISPKVDQVLFQCFSKMEIIQPNGMKIDTRSYHIKILSSEVEVQKINVPLNSFRDAKCWGKKEFLIYLPPQK